MRQIDDYLDAAKVRLGVTSDNKLSQAIGINQSAVCGWRLRKAWPKDEIMVRVAALAGIPPTVALVELNIWRSGPEAQKVYRRLLGDFKIHQPSH